MSDIVCLCNTYTQLILAIQLKNSIKKDDKVKVLLSDHSRNADKIVLRLKQMEYFDDIIYFETKHLDQKKAGIRNFVTTVIKTALGNNPFNNENLRNNKCDEFIYYNLHISTEAVFTFLSRQNKEMICSRFEEGLLSYNTDFNETFVKKHMSRCLKSIVHLRKLLRKPNADNSQNFYCFYPDLYFGKAKAVKVPFITDSTCSEVLSQAFGIKKGSLEYPQKYIFFASVGDFEGGKPVGELELAIKISELVGKENLLIKEHPRDRRGAFANAGLKVDKNSAIPWEVIQLNYDFSDHVFLTVSSTSVFGVNMMIANRTETYFLYKLCDVSGNDTVQNSIRNIEDIFSETKRVDISGYHIAENIQEIL